MHLNKQQNELVPNDKNNKNILNNTATSGATATGIAIKTSPTSSLSVETSANKITLRPSDIGIRGNTTVTTSTSCTSSTDSGVNISDNEIQRSSPSPKSQVPSFTSHCTSTINPFQQQQYRNNTTNEDKNIHNNNNAVDDDDDVDIEVQTLNSTPNFDKNFKNEESRLQQQQQKSTSQSFITVENSSNENINYHRTSPQYQINKNNKIITNNQNAIKSENVINVSHHPGKTAATTTNSEISSFQQPLQYDGFNDPLRSNTSSPTVSSSANSSKEYPPFKMPHSYHNGSPVVSIRSIDSSIIDSDSDSDINDDIEEGEHENYVIKKLGTQVSYPPRHPEIPNINKGLKVLNQHVSLNGGSGLPPSPLAALSAIGDSLGVAHGLGSVPSNSAVPQRPQIGSIALSNSSDVTFGDKHFYEGPVTIQQFLIDGRDKWKDSNGKDNPTYDGDNADTPNYAKDIHSSSAQSSKLYEYISKRKKYIIPGVLTVLALLIVAIILGSEVLNDSKSKLELGNNEESRKNIPINSTIDTNSDVTVNDDECDFNHNNTLCLIDRDVWRAHPQKNKMDLQVLPLHRAVISHTASEPCESLDICKYHVRVLQALHMDSFGWDDIGYNFLIGSDGRVYVGRGWDAIGAHTKGYNTDSVGITFIGTYMKIQPTDAQLNACRLLLEEGVRLKKLVPNYRLYGARQLGATESPGDILYKIIKTWDPHDNVGGGNVLRIVPRDGWLAQPPINPWVPLDLPVERVIIINTRTAECETQAACVYIVRISQTFNIESLQQDDIIYNFLIGGDGNVYEGRGWDNRGSVIKGYNDDSISLAYIGLFKKQPPSGKQLNVTRLLLEEGVRLNKLSDDYRLIGANKLEPGSTATSADALYKSFENWPHWSDD